MPNTPDPWFVTERSEAFAKLLLASRTDVSVRSEKVIDNYLDLLVEIHTDEPFSTILFGVLVKGTTQSDPNNALRTVKQLFRERGGPISLPACVFVVNVRENKAFYAWLAEPVVEGKGATLRLHTSGTFHSLDPAQVGEIVERVKGWYTALSDVLQPA